MVGMRKIENGEDYNFRLVSRTNEYALLNELFAEVFKMRNMSCIVDFAKEHFNDVTEKVTKWYIHTKNDSILACQRDILLCKLTDDDYTVLLKSRLGLKIRENERSRQEDIERKHILEIKDITDLITLETVLKECNGT